MRKKSDATSENPFASYLIQNLPKNLLETADLNRINNFLYINFELDDKKEPFNTSSNSRSKDLKNAIFYLFKKYSPANLNIQDYSKFHNYGLQILAFEDNEIKIKTSTRVISEKLSIFPGCENSKNIQSLRYYFNKAVQIHFAKKFNANLPNTLGLSSGKKKSTYWF